MPSTKKPRAVTVDSAIEILNRIHAADPTVLPRLINYRVPCNQALADDPTTQVGVRLGVESALQPYEAGLLGIINGIFGVDDRQWGWIAASYNKETERLLGFIRADRPNVEALE